MRDKMQQYGPWQIKESNTVYTDPFVDLQIDQVIRPDGIDGQHVVVTIKPGVCVIALDKNRNVHLTKEFHYAVGRESLEGISGGIEPGDKALPTAQRELQEEVGLIAHSWRYLTTVDPFTTCLKSPTELYLATDLVPTDRAPEGTELIETVVMSLEEAIQEVCSGRITHAPTCVALLLIGKRRFEN